jgi:hypothetical protein
VVTGLKFPPTARKGNELHRKGEKMRANQRTERENQALVAAGFESTDEEDDLWRSKDGVWFGRNAAMQRARQTLRTSTGRDVFDEEVV